MKTTTVAALAATSVLVPADALTLVKRTSPKVVPMQFHRRTEPKIFTSPTLRRRAGTVTETLDNFEDGSLYFANVTIGTPAQDFRFHLDTGSSDLWTNVKSSSECSSNSAQSGNDQGNNIPCSVSGTYAPNSSSTYEYINSGFKIQYADGSGAQGDYVSDTVRMGGATLTDQQFGVGYKSSSAEGVMGIGFTKLEAQYQTATTFANQQTYANIPQNMVNQGYINSNAYSLWLDDLYSATGNILFGGVDTDKYQGSLRTLDIVKENGELLEMLVTLNSVTVNVNGQSTTALSSDTTVLLDSGSTLTYVPQNTASTIYNAVGASYESQYGLAFCSCALANSSDTLTFDFAGKEITVTMTEIVLEGGISQDLDCTFAVVPSTSSTSQASAQQYTLGDSFIRNAYIVYDLANGQISLAQTNNQATSSNVLEIGTGTNSVPDVTGSAAAASTNLGGCAENILGDCVSRGAFAAAGAASVALLAGLATVASMLF